MNEQKTPLIYERIANVMADIRAIDKAQRNEQQRFMFRGIDDVLNGVQPAMAKNQVFITQEIVGRERKECETVTSYQGKESVKKFIHCIYQYRFRFWTVDGSYVETFVDGEGIDYGDKAANKCGSIALKYALINTLLIPTKEMDDPDASSHEVVKSRPVDNVGQSAKPQPSPTPPVVVVPPSVVKSEPAKMPDELLIGEKIAAAFKKDFAIDRRQVESFVGCKMADCTDNEIAKLREAFGRLKAGEPANLVLKSAVTNDLF